MTMKNKIVTPKTKDTNMIEEQTMAELERELCPANQNVTKIKVIKKVRAEKAKTKVNTATIDQAVSELQADCVNFEGIDAFKNCNSFIQFYRSQLTCIDKAVKFHYDYKFDRTDALHILDLLIENNRDNNQFVKAWIRYFHSMFLKGRNVLNKDKTSLNSFKETFSVFNKKYVVQN